MALHSSIQTIKGINFRGTNWNDKQAVEELVAIIANAPKLTECRIRD